MLLASGLPLDFLSSGTCNTREASNVSMHIICHGQMTHSVEFIETLDTECAEPNGTFLWFYRTLAQGNWSRNCQQGWAVAK